MRSVRQSPSFYMKKRRNSATLLVPASPMEHGVSLTHQLGDETPLFGKKRRIFWCNRIHTSKLFENVKTPEFMQVHVARKGPDLTKNNLRVWHQLITATHICFARLASPFLDNPLKNGYLRSNWKRMWKSENERKMIVKKKIIIRSWNIQLASVPA